MPTTLLQPTSLCWAAEQHVRRISMNEFLIKPLEGIGPISFGMARSEVHSSIPSHPKAFRKTKDSLHETDVFEELGFHVYYEGIDPVIEFIELFAVENSSFILDGIDIFRTQAKDLVMALCAKAKFIEEDPGCCYIFPKIELSLWRSCLPEADEPDQFMAIELGKQGYFSNEICEPLA